MSIPFRAGPMQCEVLVDGEGVLVVAPRIRTALLVERSDDSFTASPV
jgi:hypothetical protein